MTPSSATLRARAAVVRGLREWLHAHGYVEVEAPCLVRSPAMEPHLEALPAGARWLHTSPEFALKRVLSGELPRVFSLGPCFRADEHGDHHGTEFTLLEWYRSGDGYLGVLDDLEGLVAAAAAAVGVSAPRSRRATWAELWSRLVPDPGHARYQDEVEVFRAWVHHVEPALTDAVVVLDYPANQAAFAEVRGQVCERFEWYWRGVELANAFTELRDGAELERRVAACNAQRTREGRSPYPLDDRLVEAVSRQPRAGGAALGVDRLVMLLLDAPTIHHVRLEG